MTRRSVLCAAAASAVTAIAAATGSSAATHLASSDHCARSHHRCRARRPTCPAHVGHTLAASRSARVWYAGRLGQEDDGPTYRGCLKATGRVHTLASLGGCLHECDSIGLTVLSNRYVAWDYRSEFSYGGDTTSSSSDTVQVHDLGSGKMVSSALVYSEQSSASGPQTGGGLPVAILLDAHGTAVVLTSSTGSYTLSELTGGARTATAIDAGAIAPESVKLVGELLSWTNAGQPRSASVP